MFDIQDPTHRLRLKRDYKVSYSKAYDTTKPSVTSRVAEKQRSTKAFNVYEALALLPRMEEFKGQVLNQPTAKIQYMIENKELVGRVAVPVAALERGEAPQFANKFELLGYAAKRRPDEALLTLLQGAFTTKDYTGKNFIDTDKAWLPEVANFGTFTNKMTAKPSANSWEAAKVLMGNILDPNGKPISDGESLVVLCSTYYESTFKTLFNAQMVAQVVTGEGVASVSNIYQGDATIIAMRGMNAAAHRHKWFVLDTSLPVRAIIDQVETEPRFEAYDAPDCDCVKNRKEVEYEVYQRANVGMGLPQLIVGSDGTTDAL